MFEPLNREFLDQPDAAEGRMLELWNAENLLASTLRARRGAPPFVFYEGPPTANGQPGLHHVWARTLKDAMCRFHTMRGKRVLRKAGWDTHGLPVELEVEKQLGINGKPEIERLGVARFNAVCRASVFRYQEEWERLSRRIGFLLDYEHAYATLQPDYIESIWFLLSRFAANGLLYRGYRVLPWCGRCGTALSSHEVGLGYQDVDDPSVWVGFPIGAGPWAGVSLVCWTTTTWTLPSNLAVCVHPDFEYAVVAAQERRYLLLEAKADQVFGPGRWTKVATVRGRDLVGLPYEPLYDPRLLREIRPGRRLHVVVADDFVSAEEGTGLVHVASYGADDFRIAQREDLRVGLTIGEEGRFLREIGGVPAGTFYREAHKIMAGELRARGRLVKVDQYRHSYPHCWRCDTPLFYFPAPAWMIKTTAFKDAMVAENRRITWSPAEIGTGRFGEWLENNVDWALSRSRYWGTPLPVWMNDTDEQDWVCVGSFAELARRAGKLPEDFDPHRPLVDEITWPAAGGKGTMRRVPEVIDCWFDSGAMPFAQYHWPFENRELVAEQFPADVICEGLDQTRGWFYTLHAIATFATRVDQGLWRSGSWAGSPLPRLRPGGAYRSCLVNGLLLDAQGRKMSKRLGNKVDPWDAISRHGVDAIRWNFLAGGATHLSRRYSDDAITEVRRRLFGTLTASYDFLALYARTEGWSRAAPRPPRAEREAIDRWILSRAAGTARECAAAWERLEPSAALRVLERLIIDELSNWYIRRSRRRFWGEHGPASQQAAFATLYEVLHAAVRMAAPVAPFLSDAVWRRLEPDQGSVHLASFPDPAQPPTGMFSADLDAALEAAMDPILRAASLGRAVRERVRIRVRQPLARLLVHVTGEERLAASPRGYGEALREELNVKSVEWVDGVPDFLEVRAKPNYPRLGKRVGKDMKALAEAIAGLDRATLFALQGGGTLEIQAGAGRYTLAGEDVLIETVSVAGLEAATDGVVTIGLSVEVTPELRQEGVARELLNRIQTQRKEQGLDVSDRIVLRVAGPEEVRRAVHEHGAWIAQEALAPEGVECVDQPAAAGRSWELAEGLSCVVQIERK